jgi:hypothetical protein
MATRWTRERDQLKQAQYKDEILAISEFDFPFPHFDILPREGAVILRLHGFEVVSLIGFNPDLIRTGDLVMLVIHTRMYTSVQIWLKIGDGTGG